MSNTISKGKSNTDSKEIEVYTKHLFELNKTSQEAVFDFALHDIDDKEGLEKKRIAMHDAFTELYNATASLGEIIMGQDFDIAYLRNRLLQAEGEAREQLEEAMKQLQEQVQESLSEIWMAKVMAWLHQAAAASGPFVEKEHADKVENASAVLASVYTMLERPFVAVPSKVDGTQKLRRVALGYKAYSLLEESAKKNEDELASVLGKNKAAEAEFYDEFLNELIQEESTFRQAFNPFDEIIWRDILSSFIFEQATDLYNEALADLKKARKDNESIISRITSWKHNTAGLSEVYLAMTYDDIADTQLRDGNLEDAAKLYQSSSDAFARAESVFNEVIALRRNAEQSGKDKEHRKAQSLFCKAETSLKVLSDLLEVENVDGAQEVLGDIDKNLKKAEKLAGTRELISAIKEDLRIVSYVGGLMKKEERRARSIAEQIDFAKDLRKTGLIQDVNKSLDDASNQLGKEPSDALDSIREALNSLGILLNLDSEDEEVTLLRNRTLALLNNAKYVIQFQLSSQLQHGVKFIMSRILENLHAADAAKYYKILGNDETAKELTDLGKLAVATAYASEAQVFARQSEQWAFRSQIERGNMIQNIDDALLELDDSNVIEKGVDVHNEAILRIRHAIASFDAASEALDSVQGKVIRKKNSVDAQVKQLKAVVMKFQGDLSRLQGARSDFIAEFMSRQGENTKAQRHYDDAKDMLREAVGNYTVAAQVFQEVGDAQSAQSVDRRAKTADLLARGMWDNRQRLSRDQDPQYKSDQELAALYLGGTG